MRGAGRSSSSRPGRDRTGQYPLVRGDGEAPLVLVADDSDVTRELYSEFLVHCGLRVAQAVDGDHALRKVRKLKPDLVVMDLAMPLLDGWDATRRLKMHPKTSHIPVIALTGHVTASSLRRADDAGADAVLTKPCSPRELFSLVETMLDR